MNNSKKLCLIFMVIIVIIFLQMLNKNYKNKKNIVENFQGETLSDVIEKIDSFENKLSEISIAIDTKNSQLQNKIDEQNKKIETIHSSNLDETANNLINNISELKSFHDNYQRQLENIIDRRYDLEKSQYQIKQNAINQTIDEINALKTKISGKNNINKDNINALMLKSNKSNKTLMLEKVPKPWTDDQVPEYKVKFMNEDKSTDCLSYEKSNEIITARGEICVVDAKNQNFYLQEITSQEDYKAYIKSPKEVEVREIFHLIFPISEKETVANEKICLTFDEIDELSFSKVDGDLGEQFTKIN